MSASFGGCGCSLGREVCDCGAECRQGRGPQQKQPDPWTWHDFVLVVLLVWVIVCAINGWFPGETP